MGKFADKLAAQPLYFQNAYLSSAVKSQVESGKFAEYYKLLTDFDYLEAKIKRPNFGVQALITDYDLIDELKVAPVIASETKWSEAISPNHKLLQQNATWYDSDDNSHEVGTLKLIQGTLRLSAHILAEDHTQLAGQLLGRLLSFPQPDIQALLAQAKQWQDDPWLRPLTPSLTPPGGRLLRTLTGHSDRVWALALTPDGKRVISASSDSTLKVWDLADGKEVFTLTGHSSLVNALALTPDGKRVISASGDNTLKVWDLADGKEVFTFTGHSDWVNALALTPDGKHVISASRDNTLKVWDLADGKEVFTLTGHSSLVNALALTPDGKHVISASGDSTLKVWDLADGKVVTNFTAESSVWCCAVAPDGMTITAGDTSGQIHFLQLEAGL